MCLSIQDYYALEQKRKQLAKHMKSLGANHPATVKIDKEVKGFDLKESYIDLTIA